MCNPLVVPQGEKSKAFKEGDEVKIRYGRNIGTISGRVIRPISDTTYLISVNGVVKKAHQNEMILNFEMPKQ